MTYVLIVIVVCILLFAKMALVIIPQSETRIIERLGRYHATLKPGVNIIIPFVDRAKDIVAMVRGRYVYTNNIDLREQVYDFPKQNVITKDNVQTEINALLYFQIVDPFKAVYEINNLPPPKPSKKSASPSSCNAPVRSILNAKASNTATVALVC